MFQVKNGKNNTFLRHGKEVDDQQIPPRERLVSTSFFTVLYLFGYCGALVLCLYSTAFPKLLTQEFQRFCERPRKVAGKPGLPQLALVIIDIIKL